MTVSTFAYNWTLADRRDQSGVFGRATRRSANSRWNMRMAVRQRGRWERRRKTRGEDIWYGVFEMQASKYGKSALTKSPITTSSFRCSGLPWTRLITSAAIRGSSSMAVTCFAFSNIRMVRLPVPGPTSRTLSVGLRFACQLLLSHNNIYMCM